MMDMDSSDVPFGEVFFVQLEGTFSKKKSSISLHSATDGAAFYSSTSRQTQRQSV